jgi:predicted DNA-binding transcriptional regulator YafY
MFYKREGNLSFLIFIFIGEIKLKIERALGVLFLLLNRKNITASEMANYFEVSQRTVYRDIELLAGAGVPIYCEQGRNGGISIVEGWSIAGGSFNSEDIEVIKSALQGVVNSFGDKKSCKTLEKIERIAEISSTDNREKIYIDFTAWGDDKPNEDFRKVIQDSIEKKEVVEFIYRNQKGEENGRIVEPMAVVFKGFSWYLHGICREKKEWIGYNK